MLILTISVYVISVIGLLGIILILFILCYLVFSICLVLGKLSCNWICICLDD